MFKPSFHARLGAVASVLVLVCSESWSQPFTTVLEVPPASIGDNYVADSNTQINVRRGGSIGNEFMAQSGSSNVEVNLYGGSIGWEYTAYAGSTLNIYSGEVGAGLQNYGGTVNLYDGALGLSYQSWTHEAVINVFGGYVERYLELNAGTANIHGGTLLNPFYSGGEINLFGSGFTLDGHPITGLVPGVPTLIDQRGGVPLGGVLEDGTAFEFGLFGDDDYDISGRDDGYFADDSTVTVTLTVPHLAGDYDGNGFVSQSDLDLVLLNWGDSALPDGWVAEAQFDGQAVSQNELDAVLLNWGTGGPPIATSVPEPSTAAFATVIGVGLAGRRIRKLQR